jgi:branched-chain amino acid aminotransferase
MRVDNDGLVAPRYAWLDGEVVPWQDARLHVRTQAVMRGASIFEGIRAYWNVEHNELFLFRLQEHLRRLLSTASFLRFELPYGEDELRCACCDLLRANEARTDVHLYLHAYVGEGERFGMMKPPKSFGCFISAIPDGPSERSSPVTCCVSSWQRIGDSSMPPRLKASANYHNSYLALLEARESGFDRAIFLNARGKVAEADGACVFLVRHGVTVTPSITSDILESITRDTIIQLLEEGLGVTTVEREVDRTELYFADEIFLCATSAEIAPVREIDRRRVGNRTPGDVTRRIRELYVAAARGEDESRSSWLTPVYGTHPSGGGVSTPAAVRTHPLPSSR